MMQSNIRKPIDLDRVHEAVLAPLGLVEDEARRNDLERFLDAARVFQERAVFDLLSDVTSAANESGATSRLLLEYEAGRLYLTVLDQEAEAEPIPGQDGALEKVTVRLPTALKQSLDQASAAEGISLNSWCLHALWRTATRHARRRGGSEATPGHNGPRERGRRRRSREVD
jgi:hypothetical protein